MSTSISIKQTAADKKTGMTVAELTAFQADLEHAGVDTQTPLKITMGWRSQLTSIEATG